MKQSAYNFRRRQSHAALRGDRPVVQDQSTSDLWYSGTAAALEEESNAILIPIKTIRRCSRPLQTAIRSHPLFPIPVVDPSHAKQGNLFALQKLDAILKWAPQQPQPTIDALVDIGITKSLKRPRSSCRPQDVWLLEKHSFLSETQTPWGTYHAHPASSLLPELPELPGT